VTAAIVTYDCKACGRPMARVLGPGTFRAIGLTVRMNKGGRRQTTGVEVDCPWCGAPNGLNRAPAVDPQDIPADKPLDISGGPVQDSGID
jgi:hypothetical protein